MEATRTFSCVGCGDPVEAPRCAHCGVAVAPGGWKVLRQIAKGPHSRVFLAEKHGQQVALKELLFALVPDAAQLEGFEREARLLSQLKHPAIPKLVESFREGEGIHTRLYLAQDFVRGRSLLEQLQQHRFDEREARALARSLLEVLEYLHGLSPRVIHRDLKPANVMRREDGSLALVDFGAARDLVRGVTHGSTLVGTFGYMPPEQLGGTVDLTSDLYALGATLLHLLSRKSPDELLKSGMELAFEDHVNVSAPMRGWLKKLVERDRTARFQSAQAALAGLDGLDRPVMRAPVGKKAGSGPMAVLVASGFAFSLVVGLGLVVTTRSSEPQVPAIAAATSEQPRPPPAVPSRTVEAKPALAPAPTAGQVVTVPKRKPLPQFVLESPFAVSLSEQIQLGSPDCSLTVTGVTGAPGAPATLTITAALEAKAEASCASTFVELVDQQGGRDPSRATLLSSPKGGTSRQATTRFKLPANSRTVQLRFGPQAKPLAVISVDLLNGTAARSR